MTIEERAKKCYPPYFNMFYGCGIDCNVPFQEAYIKGATDQKAIDDEAHSKVINEGAKKDFNYSKLLEKQKIELTARALEAFEKAVGWCRTYPWYEGVCKEFVKAMEDRF